MKPMFLLAVWAVAAQVFGAPATYDSFDHAVGDALGRHGEYPGKTAVTGQTWYAGGIYGTTSTLDAVIAAESLWIRGLQDSGGNSVQLLGIAASNGVVDRIRIGDPTPQGKAQVYTSGELYYSLILRVIALTDPGDPTPIALNGAFLAGFNNRNPDEVNASGTTSAATRLHVCLHDTDSTRYRIGLRPNRTAAPLVFDPTPRTPGPDSEPVFIVGRYLFVEGGTTNDLHELWVNPPPDSFGAATPPAYTAGGTSFPLSATGMDIGPATDNVQGPPAVYCFFIRQNNVTAHSMVMDEVRVGLSWADVTPPGTSVFGPCCRSSGGCSDLPASACNGTWSHPGLTCEDITCAAPIGPCCAPDGSCTETTLADCAGTWDKPGRTCAEVTCSCTRDPVFDSDCDRDVDLDDFGAFQACITGSGDTASLECKPYDRDGDSDVDGDDFGSELAPGTFVYCASGPAVPADPTCDGTP